MQSCMHTYTHTLHAYIHAIPYQVIPCITYIHTYIHTHTYRHIYGDRGRHIQNLSLPRQRGTSGYICIYTYSYRGSGR